jgi:alpha-galactosidase
MKTKGNLLALAVLFAGSLTVSAVDSVKVFILAGQSNMEGKADQKLIDHQATDAKTRDFFKHLRTGDAWTVRDDVFIKFLGRHGGLTTGFGSPGKTGPELEFGHMMGEKFDEPVLLIKAAWGGHSLYQKFRSPAAGMPGDEILQAELENARKRTKASNEKHKKNDPLPTMEQIKEPYGMSYRNMMKELEETKANYETLFPALKGKKWELAGFVWFQGFNDMFGDHAPGEYADNMKHFISDVRKDLKKPDLPFVIAAIGNNGSKPAKGGMLAVSGAQMSMNEVPEFKGNVKAFRTDELVDKAAEELFPTWKANTDLWEKTGSDRPYHYYGSGIWYGRIGKTAGEAMLELLSGDKREERRPASNSPHVFRSADGKRSFKAVLIDYDPESEMVSVKMPNLRISKFKIDVLSAEDQDYVQKGE